MRRIRLVVATLIACATVAFGPVGGNAWADTLPDCSDPAALAAAYPDAMLGDHHLASASAGEGCVFHTATFAALIAQVPGGVNSSTYDFGFNGYADGTSYVWNTEADWCDASPGSSFPDDVYAACLAQYADDPGRVTAMPADGTVLTGFNVGDYGSLDPATHAYGVSYALIGASSASVDPAGPSLTAVGSNIGHGVANGLGVINENMPLIFLIAVAWVAWRVGRKTLAHI